MNWLGRNGVLGRRDNMRKGKVEILGYIFGIVKY